MNAEYWLPNLLKIPRHLWLGILYRQVNRLYDGAHNARQQKMPAQDRPQVRKQQACSQGGTAAYASTSPQSSTMNFKKKYLTILLLAANASASGGCTVRLDAVDKIQTYLSTIGVPLAWFMAAYMGVKWIVSESPEERENARRGIIYIIIGVIILRTADSLTLYLFC
jgi:hypothetical protein